MSKIPPPITRRKTLKAFLAGIPLGMAGCLSVKDLDDIQADWDRKHPEGTGVMFSKLPKMIHILATYEATKRQREIAQQRALAAYQQMVRQRSRQVTAKSKPKSAPAGPAKIVSVSNPNRTLATASTPEATQQKAVEVAQKTGETVVMVPQKIAIETPKDERFEGESAVMLWNTASFELVGNHVYDVKETPKKGTVSLWSGVSAEYVGYGTR